MKEVTKKIISGASLLALFGGGTAVGRFTKAAVAPIEVHASTMRWLGPTTDQAHPYYFEINFVARHPGEPSTGTPRSIKCWTDGTSPTLDGSRYLIATKLCSHAESFGALVEADIDDIRDTIMLSNVPDAAQAPVDASQ